MKKKKRMSKMEAIVLSIKFWKELRDKGYNFKWDVEKPDLIHILEMECKCPLCEYATQLPHYKAVGFCYYGCPLSECTKPGQPYQDWTNSATKEEKIANADRLVKKLEDYVKKVMKKKLVIK